MQERLAELKEQLTGDMWKDMEIMNEIHEIEMALNNVEVCSLDDEECLNCGS